MGSSILDCPQRLSVLTGFEEESDKLVLHLELSGKIVPGCLVQNSIQLRKAGH
jgi:hypothetical protein